MAAPVYAGLSANDNAKMMATKMWSASPQQPKSQSVRHGIRRPAFHYYHCDL